MDNVSKSGYNFSTLHVISKEIANIRKSRNVSEQFILHFV